MLKSIVGKLGVTSVLISAVAVSVAVGIIIYKSNELVYSKPISISTIEVASYNAQDLKRFDQYKTIIDSALKVKAERLDVRSLKMFGYTDSEVLAKVNMEEQIYDLSMVYESAKGRYAVINDKFYKPGDTLPDGSKVQEVSMAGVVIVNNGLANILSVEKKLDAPVNGPITGKSGLRNRKEDELNSPENVVKAVQKIQKIQESMRVLQNSQINDLLRKKQ